MLENKHTGLALINVLEAFGLELCGVKEGRAVLQLNGRVVEGCTRTEGTGEGTDGCPNLTPLEKRFFLAFLPLYNTCLAAAGIVVTSGYVFSKDMSKVRRCCWWLW